MMETKQIIEKTEAVESAERAIKTVKDFLNRLTLQKNAAIIIREQYKDQLKMEKEHLEEEYEQQLEKEQNAVKDLSKELTEMREKLFAVCVDSETRLDYMRSLSIHKLPISFDLQVCLVCAGFDTLGDVLKLSKKEVAKVNGIAPFLRELDALVWRSGLDYRAWK